MMLTISFKHPSDEKNTTIMVDDRQKISETLNVLTEAGILEAKDCRIVRSARTKERIRVEKSYAEGHVYNGDILALD